MSALPLQEYRERVCSGIASYHGSSSATKTPRKPRPAGEPGVKKQTTRKKPMQAKPVILEDAHGKSAALKRKKSATPYKDPMAVEKLEMISKIRAQRTAQEIEKKEAIRRARYTFLFQNKNRVVLCETHMLLLVLAGSLNPSLCTHTCSFSSQKSIECLLVPFFMGNIRIWHSIHVCFNFSLFSGK